MAFLQRVLSVTLFICSFLLSGLHAQNGTVISLSQRLDGSQNQLVNNAAITVEDALYARADLTQVADTPYLVNNRVIFKINEQSATYTGAAFTATLQATITYEVAPGHMESVNKSFTINYDPANAYGQQQSMVFTNAHKVTVQVTGITINGAAATAPLLNLLLLENDMDIHPAYKFSYAGTANTIRQLTLQQDAVKTDELVAGWPNTIGADEYDLEWTYIDSTALSRYQNTSGQFDAALLFRNNATRITTANLSYNIPLVYDNSGVLFVRARAVQRLGAKGRLEAAWSSDYIAPLTAAFAFYGHERTLNWQANTSFAEDGKRKVVVQYFDGSLRNRQTVTKDNTVNKTIVAETLYDQQGRPAIQVMPAPTLNSIISYSKLFNTNSGGNEYDKNEYDQLSSPSAYCSAVANPMNTATGAAMYYSANNPEMAAGLNKYLPNANGYAFTETQYTQDNTGRISRQSGVGDGYKLGSGHETQYFYGSPSQAELDALFGTEVGDKSHYFKNMVRDANGQFSVSYVDMHGRTIATALAGQLPDSIKLSLLPSYTTDTVTDDISDMQQANIVGQSLVNSRSLLVAFPSNHHFSYHLDPMAFYLPDCNGNNIKYDCLYDVVITVTDDCNNQKLGGAPYIKKFTNVDAGSVIPADATNTALNFNFDLVLQPGNYEVTKTLTLSKLAMDYYRENVYMKNDSCVSFNQVVAQQRIAQKIGQNCSVSDTAVVTQADEMRINMLLDVTAPSGQYANPDASGKDAYSIFYNNSDDARLVNNDVNRPYKRSDLVYLDDDGFPDTVYSAQAGKYVKPQQLSVDEFAAAFKASWANTLLKLHPEYCKLVAITNHQASMRWDEDFKTTETYQDALAKGYLNPTGNTAAPFNRYPAGAKTDPLAQESTQLKSRLENMLRQYSGSMPYNLWALAAISTLCDGSQPCADGYQNGTTLPFSNTSCTGDLDAQWRSFRDLYLQAKNNIYLDFSGTCNNPTPQQLLNATPVPHQPEFNNPATILSDYASILGNTSSTDAMTASAQSTLLQAYDNNCQAYISQWKQQLAACTLYSAGDLQHITDTLYLICRAAADADHPFGASSLPATATFKYKSFDEFITAYNNNNNFHNTDILCSSSVITSPAPYNGQAYTNQITYTKPTDCQCTTINNINQTYVKNPQGYPDLAAYLKGVMHVSMSSADVNELLNMCNTASNCKYLSHAITLPPVFQCSAGSSSCATCVVVGNLDSVFTARYNKKPLLSDTSAAQQQVNQLYVNYMNSHLGFSYGLTEYLNFLDSCHKSTYYTVTQVCTTEPTLRIYQSAGTDSISHMLHTADGGSIMVGNTNGFNNVGLDGYIIKTDSLGNRLWAKTYGLGSDESISKIRLTSDGGYIVIGTVRPLNSSVVLTAARSAVSVSPPPAVTPRKVFVMKITATGDVSWSKTYRFGSYYGESGNDITPLSTGGFAITGRYNDSAMVYSNLAAVLDNAGNISWSKYFGLDANIPTEDFSADDAVAVVDYGDTLVVASNNYSGWFGDAPYTLPTVYKLSKSNGTIYDSRVIDGYDQCFFYFDKTVSGNAFEIALQERLQFPNSKPSQYNFFQSGHIYPSNLLDATGYPYYYYGNNSWGGNNTMTFMHAKHQGDYGLVIINAESNPSSLWTVLDNHTTSVQYINTIATPGSQSFASIASDAGKGYIAVGNYNSQNVLWAHSDSTVHTQTCDAFYNGGFGSQSTRRYYIYPLMMDVMLTGTAASATITTATVTPKDSTLCSKQTCAPQYNYIGPLLCGGASPLFPDTALSVINNCSDSSYNLISTSTQIYNHYLDSLRGNFDSTYTAQALLAYRHEVFSVAHVNSEYHYTLYYYDQAGNLVKTIAPQGVHAIRRATWIDSVASFRRHNLVLVPPHTEPTQYRYNTLNQVMAQQSPDGGQSLFWYDRLGRLAVSQNAKQQSNSQYSYTSYDYLGRITEVGQLTNGTAMTDAVSRNELNLQSWITAVAGSKEQITATVYDYPNINIAPFLQPVNLRNRVAYSAVFNSGASLAANDYVSATHYSYDIHGNVDTLVQEYRKGLMADKGNAFKRVVYDYDLVSGKVNQVSYQPVTARTLHSPNPDAFYHRYAYDAENRLTDVFTSADSQYWEHDANYAYYRHGPLARATLGNLQVQGLDYIYTLQGWMKAINPLQLQSGGPNGNGAGCGPASTTAVDDLTVNVRNAGGPAQYTARNTITFADGFVSAPSDEFATVVNSSLASCTPTNTVPADGTTASTAATDAFNLVLTYNRGDYQPISADVSMPAANIVQGLGTNMAPLFNGNISNMAVNLPRAGSPMVYNYHYDQLNRIAQMDAFAASSISFGGLTNNGDYGEKASYDANGNIQAYKRNGSTAAGGQSMDNLTYHYYTGSTNKLEYITDAVGAQAYAGDVDNMQAGNYQYDAIGNIIADASAGITHISWTVYGKIQSIQKADGTTISYTYDATGNRISKAVTSSGNTVTTWYVRDAQGNVLDVYTAGNSSLNNGHLSQSEIDLYGSARLGMLNSAIDVENAAPANVTSLPGLDAAFNSTFVRGNKLFELSNHLGNVLATVSDRHGVFSNNNTTIDHYEPVVLNATDYYPFGMEMPGRVFSGGSYRYGFNGQEKSDEIASGLTTAEFWEYDARTGVRWNVDPVKKPWQSDYATFSNNPIWRIDPDGDDDFFNSNGILIKQTKTGSKIYVQTDKGNVLLTQVNLNSATNRQTVANVVGWYAFRVGIIHQPKNSNENAGAGRVGLKPGAKSPEDNPAFTTSDKDVYINDKGNKINSNLDDYYNLENTLIHEKGHKTEFEKGVKGNLVTHVGVYLGAIKDETFRKSTEAFQTGTIGSFGNYLLNYYVDFTNGGTTQLDKYVNDFNKNNKSGFLIQLDISASSEKDYKVNIYKKNKLVGTVKYSKIKNEGGDK